MTEKLDTAGQLTAAGGIGMYIWNAISKNDINDNLVLVTSLVGLVYLVYGIIIRRKKVKLLNIELKDKKEEINE